ncbi:MAG TPA: ABC transporter ATP-binding protein [Syntrophales bacterium]|nr:ABC transporter ATP-binding protein [Syntrophales bacterium]HOL59306.1 ABC transporter ATP-binding protein [Syntrophales bacterium]HPO35501.1 ABC transporter ATP-binding protein [Syntrophales bacterium]
MPLIETYDIHKIYAMEENPVYALNGVTLSIEKGEFVAIMGPSGSGKSTFMSILGCLDKPTQGAYKLDGIDVEKMSRDDLAQVRNEKIGFVFQGFNLLSRASALENVELPMIYRGIPAGERRKRAMEALAMMGLADRATHLPSQLSGGQQQRVAIARSLVNNAPLLMADEPTGNLDTKTSIEIMELLVRLNRDNGITIVLVTHESDIAAFSHRIIRFLDGKVISDERKH